INKDTLHSFHPFDMEDIYVVAFEIFTENILFIQTKNTVTKISNRTLNKIIQAYRQETDSLIYDPQDYLTEGIENQSLTSEFLQRVLGLNDSPQYGFLHCDRLGLYLEFSNGILCGFQPSDGLNRWAKDLKLLNPKYLERYFNEAAKYWGNNQSKVTNEVNAQAEAWADTVNSIKNQYCELHTTPSGSINFVNLLVAHYGKYITIDDFLEINHGRYQALELTKTGAKFKVAQMIYKSDGIRITNAYLDTD
ncbi:MAG: hypothetical protein R2822_20270, partial [Spirosomataceae bacterium]